MQPDSSVLNLAGAKQVMDWFGFWPSFHDAEILNISFDRENASRIRVHYFATNAKVNKNGYYATEKHAIVSFIIEDPTHVEIYGFNQQNVMSSIAVTPVETGYEIQLVGCYGISGHITAKNLRFELEPGMPANSNYSETLL